MKNKLHLIDPKQSTAGHRPLSIHYTDCHERKTETRLARMVQTDHNLPSMAQPAHFTPHMSKMYDYITCMRFQIVFQKTAFFSYFTFQQHILFRFVNYVLNKQMTQNISTYLYI